MLNWIFSNRTVFLTLKLYLHLTELLHITAWIVWNKCFWQLNCVLMLNWTVFNRTDYLHKNGFGVK